MDVPKYLSILDYTTAIGTVNDLRMDCIDKSFGRTGQMKHLEAREKGQVAYLFAASRYFGLPLIIEYFQPLDNSSPPNDSPRSPQGSVAPALFFGPQTPPFSRVHLCNTQPTLI